MARLWIGRAIGPWPRGGRRRWRARRSCSTIPTITGRQWARGCAKRFRLFERPFDPAELVAIKLETNRWEEEYIAQGEHAEPRPLNLDPGYLTLGKLVLASTKDFAHRIYLNRGIYAEITLYYRHHRWQDHPFTFADYPPRGLPAVFSANVASICMNGVDGRR